MPYQKRKKHLLSDVWANNPFYDGGCESEKPSKK